MKKVLKHVFAFVCVFLGVLALVSCDSKKKYEGTAAELLKSLLLKEDGTTVSGDFTVPATVKGADEVFNVTWTSKNEDALKFEAPVDEKVTAKVTPLKEDVVVHFEASVDVRGDKASRDYRVKIGRYVSPEETFYNFYDKASANLTYNLTGYIVAKEVWDEKYKSASIYLLDQTLVGAYYCYSVKMTQEFYNELKIGDAVTVQNAVSDKYNGLVETKSGATIIRTDLPTKTVEELTAAVDLTNLIMAEQTDEISQKITYNQSRYAKLDQFVVISDKNGINFENTSTTQTIVKLAKVEGKNYAEFTLALNRKLVPLDSDTATAINEKVSALKKGDVVNLQGLVGWYSGAQFLAMDANCVTKTGTADIPVKPDTKPEAPAENFSGVVTDSGFKDSDKSVRCYALVQKTSPYPGSAKYVTMNVDVTETMTVEKIHADWLAKFPAKTNVTLEGGEETVYKGLNQYVLKSLDNVTVGEAATATPSFLDISGKVTSGDDLTALQGLLVKVTGVCVVEGKNYKIQTAEGKAILVYFDRAFQEGTLSEVLTAGKEYTVSGFLNWFDNPQITPIDENCVLEIVPQANVEGTNIVFESLSLDNGTAIAWVNFTDGQLRGNIGTHSGSAPAYYSSDKSLRIYVGNTLTIKSTKKIVKIEFKCIEANPLTSKSTVKDGTMDYTTFTWTGETNEFVLTSGDKARFTSIVVTYAE